MQSCFLASDEKFLTCLNSKMPKIMARYPKMESIGSTGSILLGILEIQPNLRTDAYPQTNMEAHIELYIEDSSLIAGPSSLPC